jgi:hypothetical protein
VFTSYRVVGQPGAFRIAKRAASLAAADEEIILAHIAEETSQTFPLERIVRSINAALRDNACAEYIFILQFFIHRSETEGADIFARVFRATLKSMLVK